MLIYELLANQKYFLLTLNQLFKSWKKSKEKKKDIIDW